ncbi:hypothetical protein AWC18_04000 [Mycolicibacter nonchromogenicus]|uniref:Integral membrane protein n=1 Tax=Mycolicibacter nonchromogenicus TaxID=1782 RepID=A0A1X1ZKL6_MYCNO|nr:hypothetical protein [Mycolicibacter nonchromogenicus]ORW23858.1 hypothetical protein AWC18_04000 [Mycolicibacter nonchromogenicus]
MAPSSGVDPTLSRALSGLCGLAMAAVAGVGTSGAAAIVALLAAAAVLLGLRWPVAATLAVVLVVVAIGLADPPAVSAAVAGLAAVGYLALRNVGSVTPPTVILALGFTVAGLVATVFPWQLRWLPLLAPFAVFGLYAVAAQPFLRAQR